MIEEDDLDAEPPRSGGSTWRKKALAGLLALLLVGTVAGSLIGGTRDTASDDSTTTSGPPASTSSTAADRVALVDAGVALAGALTPLPGGDVQFAGDVGAADQNRPDAALVDVIGVGWYDRPGRERFAFVRTRGGPPPDLPGCFSVAVTYSSAGGLPAQGEINLGGPCASHGASETGRMAGFLLPDSALWILDLDIVRVEPATAGVVTAQLFLDGGTLADVGAVPLAAAPVAPELAEALLPLANFRPANPPDGPLAPND